MALEANHPFAQRAPRLPVAALEPVGGPVSGGTTVRFHGHSFDTELGDGIARCRFGLIEMSALVINSTLVECTSPVCSVGCIDQAGPLNLTPGSDDWGGRLASVPLEVASDGQQFSTFGLHFSFYQTEWSALITPSGGPRRGRRTTRRASRVCSDIVLTHAVPRTLASAHTHLANLSEVTRAREYRSLLPLQLALQRYAGAAGHWSSSLRIAATCPFSNLEVASRARAAAAAAAAAARVGCAYDLAMRCTNFR